MDKYITSMAHGTGSAVGSPRGAVAGGCRSRWAGRKGLTEKGLHSQDLTCPRLSGCSGAGGDRATAVATVGARWAAAGLPMGAWGKGGGDDDLYQGLDVFPALTGDRLAFESDIIANSAPGVTGRHLSEGALERTGERSPGLL